MSAGESSHLCSCSYNQKEEADSGRKSQKQSKSKKKALQIPVKQVNQFKVQMDSIGDELFAILTEYNQLKKEILYGRGATKYKDPVPYGKGPSGYAKYARK